MDIVRERLEREYELDLIVTAPNVAYRAQVADGSWVEVHNPAQMPEADILATEEPYVRASTITPKEFVGTVMELNQERRGEYHHMAYLSEERVQLVYDIPLAEIVLDYYDKLKIAHARVRVVRLRPAGLPRGPRSSRSTCCSPASGSTRSR